LFRHRRNRVFREVMKPGEHDKILDVGGYPECWDDMGCRSHVTCLNLQFSSVPYDETRFCCIKGDGRSLTCADRSFDIVFSNSVIEHVGTFEDQKKFASEIRRVGKRYWVQSPNRRFFIEPHLLAPFVHYLPRRIQRMFIRPFTLWGLFAKPSSAEIDAYFSETRLLTLAEMRSLFPDAIIYEERFLFMLKSFVAYKTA